MPKAPAYTKPKRSGESIIVSTGIGVGAALGAFLLYPTFIPHFNLYMHGQVILAQTTGAPHMVNRTFGPQKETDYTFEVKGISYHGSAAIDNSGDVGELRVYYDQANPTNNAVSYQESYLVMALFGALIFLACVSGVGALMLARRRD